MRNRIKEVNQTGRERPLKNIFQEQPQTQVLVYRGEHSEEEVGRAKVVVVSFVAIGGGSVVVMGRANKSL